MELRLSGSWQTIASRFHERLTDDLLSRLIVKAMSTNGIIKISL